MHFFQENKRFGFKEEAEVLTTRSLLPDEDDLFSAMMGHCEYDPHSVQDAYDGFDIFSSLGGLELELDDASCVSQMKSDISKGVVNGGSLLSICPYWKHPSRTLVVKNVNAQVEDYGDIKEIHEASQRIRHKLIECYDVRSAEDGVCAFNKTSIVGRQMMTKPRGPEDGRKCLMPCSSDLKQDEVNMAENPGKNLSQGRAVSCFRSNFVKNLYSANCAYSTMIAEDASGHGSSYDLHHGASSGKCYDPQTPSQAGNRMQFGSMCLPSFRPRSFIDCRDKSDTCILDYPLGTAPNIAGKSERRMTNTINCSKLSLRTPEGPSVEHQRPASSLPSLVGSRDNRRNLSHRRNKGRSFVFERERFELDVDRILYEEDSRTTLMLKNIPNRYTSKMLLSVIDEHFRGNYDFIYLPIDFKKKCNVGYAFINLINPIQVVRFHKEFSGRKWGNFNSKKVAALAYARIQGKAALISHFQKSSVMNEDKHCHPILFHTDGPNAGEQEPFPTGTTVRSRTAREWSHFCEMKEGSL